MFRRLAALSLLSIPALADPVVFPDPPAPPAPVNNMYFQPPPGASSNVNTFRQQFLDYNLQQTYNNLKANDPFFRHTELQIIQFGKDITGQREAAPTDPLIAKVNVSQPGTYTAPGPDYHLSSGIDFKMIQAYTKFNYAQLQLKSSYDVRAFAYTNQINYKMFSTYYTYTIKDSGNNVGLRINMAFN
jgi:hypothetical protein